MESRREQMLNGEVRTTVQRGSMEVKHDTVSTPIGRSKTRVYVSGAPEGENRKQTIENMRIVAQEGLALYFESLGLGSVELPKLSYSRTAGCSCGCSPAFEFNTYDADGIKKFDTADYFVTWWN